MGSRRRPCKPLQLASDRIAGGATNGIGDVPRLARSTACRPRRIVVLTGAGLSAESGLSTFRDKDGIWARYDYRDVATPEGFRREPASRARVLQHAPGSPPRRQAECGAFRPRPAGAGAPGRVTIVTQNVDALHEAAGSRNLIHMHGEVLKARCEACGATRLGPRPRSRNAMPALRRCRPPAARRRLVRRDALPHGAHRARTDAGRPVHLDRHVGQRLPGRRLRGRSARPRRPHGRAQPRAVEGIGSFAEAIQPRRGPATPLRTAFGLPYRPWCWFERRIYAAGSADRPRCTIGFDEA